MILMILFFFSLMQSLLNHYYSPAYFLAVAYVTLSVLSVMSFFVAGARPQTLKYFLTF